MDAQNLVDGPIAGKTAMRDAGAENR